ncbi:hypothetical protein, partial [uncultured Shewanella sp.]|uniref:hypothetical protein n=1 Tax=uncultured Shewanella sp. TaxID=173975 RepID=UPI0026281793
GVCKILNANLSRIQLPVKVTASLKVGINAYPLRRPAVELGQKLHPCVSGILQRRNKLLALQSP